MSKKTATERSGEATSNDAANAQPETALTVSANGDVSGPLEMALSREARDKLEMELQEAIHQIEKGFGVLTAPGKIFEMDQAFDVVDAITVSDYLDKRTGEELVKHIFCLEFGDGRVLNTMQSDARPRRVLASSFSKARALGARLRVGPYKYAKQDIKGQLQAAYIFEQQSGFAARAV